MPQAEFVRPDVLAWLLDGDPAVRWQVLRDLTDADEESIAAERSRVAHVGWGQELLALRDPDGQWVGGACFPARPLETANPADPDQHHPDQHDVDPHQHHPGQHDVDPDQHHPDPDDVDPREGPGQPWISTLPSLDLLLAFGLDPADPVTRDMVARVAASCRWEYDDRRYFDGEVEPCINGRTLAAGAYFGQDVTALATRLLDDQLRDGGWNCWTEHGSVRSSFHSTINVLEGLWAYEQSAEDVAAVRDARERGEQYLLERRLLRRRSTGDIIDAAFTRFAFPTRWHYDALRALDHLRSTGAAPDPRTAEALTLLQDKQQPDGTWLLENTYPGQVHFRLDPGDALPSRWNTLRALRVLRWADAKVTGFAGAAANIRSGT